MDDVNNAFFEAIKGKTHDEYLKLLCRAEHEPVIDGLRIPGFPSTELQVGLVGSAGSETLRNEGWRFYNLVKSYARDLNPIHRNTRILDFGCGWGRMIRFFFKDTMPINCCGIDVDPSFIQICQNNMHYGNYSACNPSPPTEFEDESFDIIYAYSVFSHLREDTAFSWIKEFSRILKPQGVLIATTEGEHYLRLCGRYNEDPSSRSHRWHEIMASCFQPYKEYIERYRNGEFLFDGRGGGKRDIYLYGETAIPQKYIEKEYGQFLRFVDFFEEIDLFGQAVFVMQKTLSHEVPKYSLKNSLQFRQSKANPIIIKQGELLDALRVNNRPIAVWGCGKVGKRALKFLLDNGLEPKCFLDSSVELQGKKFENTYIINAPKPVIESKSYFILVASSVYEEDMMRELLGSGLKLIDDFYIFPV